VRCLDRVAFCASRLQEVDVLALVREPAAAIRCRVKDDGSSMPDGGFEARPENGATEHCGLPVWEVRRRECCPSSTREALDRTLTV
jgi:hypothetical protein